MTQTWRIETVVIDGEEITIQFPTLRNTQVDQTIKQGVEVQKSQQPSDRSHQNSRIGRM
jgi:hypothetical protein